MAIESRLTVLRSQLSDAIDQIHKAEKSVKRANKKLEDAQYFHDSIIHEIDCELIKTWAGNPDWNVLLEDSELHSMFMYKYTNSLLEKMGVASDTVNLHTRQRGINIYFETTEDKELTKKQKAVEFLSRYIIPHEGRKSFYVTNIKENDCAYQLNISNHESEKTSRFYVEKMVWGSVSHSRAYKTLRDALEHIQLNVCRTDLTPIQNVAEINVNQ
ncbi:hypothetical protein [Pantoea ananatis]|uniref:hypothetical protein n=1 Tax=Pantoea ananas TaxID=553 RepID=UPI001B302612|nr:hypothetical protein [Pantoea ananatis]